MKKKCCIIIISGFFERKKRNVKMKLLFFLFALCIKSRLYVCIC